MTARPCAAAVLLWSFLWAAGAEADDVRFGAHASFAAGGDEGDAGFGLGARAALDLARTRRGLAFVGSADYFLSPEGGAQGDGIQIGVSYWELNANLIHSLDQGGRRVKKARATRLSPYLGAGLNLAHRSASIEGGGVSAKSSRTRLGLNLLGGLRVTDNVFGEVRYELGGGEQLVAAAGYLF